MEMFKVILGKKQNEFAVIGVPNVAKETMKFQGLLNGIPFCQSSNYELIRARVMRAVDLNNHIANTSLS